MASLESYGVDEYGNSNGVNLPDFTGCLLLATTPTPPAGTLVADGSEVSREAYAKLFAIFGTQYGAGDGVSTFALPDWRDEFPRFSGASRVVLTTQGDAIRNIEGSFSVRPGGDSDAEYQVINSATPPFSSSDSGVRAGEWIDMIGASTTEQRNFIYITFSANDVVPTADENRPRNVAFLPCVIYV